MAVDRSLLELAQTPVLRLYSWDPPGFSIGYFQNPSTPLPHEAYQAGAQLVRRPTGGGAIFHDREEFTFSLTLPRQQAAWNHPPQLYRQVGSALSQMAAQLGISLSLRGEGTDEREDPFLCFERASSWDLIDPSGTKMAGFAARRSRKTILVHGSVSPHSGLTHPRLVSLAPPAFSTEFKISWSESSLDDQEMNRAQILQNQPLDGPRRSSEPVD